MNIRSLLYLAVLTSYLCWAVTGLLLAQVSFAVLLVLLVIQAVPGSAGKNRNLSLGLIGIGGGLLIYSGASWQKWLASITDNGGLVVLFIILPLLSFLLEYEDYQSSLVRFFQKHIRSAAKFNILISCLGYFLTAIINIASVQLLYDLMNKNAEQYGAREDFYRALVRGNSGPIFWAPNYVCVGIVLTYTNLPWLAIVPFGLPLSCFYMLLVFLSFLLPSFLKKPETPVINEISAAAETQTDQGAPNGVSLWDLLIVYLGLIITIAVLSSLTGLKILVVLPIAGLTYPLLVAALKRKMPDYRRQFGDYFYNKLPALKNEIILFAAVGFFGKALIVTGIGNWLTTVIDFKDIPYPSIAILAILLFITIMSFVGVHPYISMAALASSLSPADLGISTLAFAYALLLSDMTGALISPFSGTSLIMSGITGVSPLNIVPKLNYFFVLFVILVFSVLLAWIR